MRRRWSDEVAGGHGKEETGVWLMMAVRSLFVIWEEAVIYMRAEDLTG